MRKLQTHKVDPALIPLLQAKMGTRVRVILHAGCRRCRDRLAVLGCPVLFELPLIRAFCADVALEWVPFLAEGQFVRYIESDVRVKTQMDIARPAIGAQLAHGNGWTGRGVSIAIADTGIYPHPDFSQPHDRILKFVDFVNDKKIAYDDNGHGTFVAGAAAGSGFASEGKYAGIAPQAGIISLKVMDAEGGGNATDILAAMQWVSDNREAYNIRVFSMSLGSQTRPKQGEDALVRGAEALWRQGVFVTAAAGNAGPRQGTVTTPAISPVIVAVGASDDHRSTSLSDETLADFSSRGNVGDVQKPDLVAPGVDITSVKADTSYKGGGDVTGAGYTMMSGTSVATPIVAGAAALLLEKYPEWNPDEIKRRLMQKAYALQPSVVGAGAGVINLRDLFVDAVT